MEKEMVEQGEWDWAYRGWVGGRLTFLNRLVVGKRDSLRRLE